jgi:hypothetical protein
MNRQHKLPFQLFEKNTSGQQEFIYNVYENPTIPAMSAGMITDVKKIPFVLVVDSRDRNYDIYPNANQYRIRLPETIHNVIRVELIAAEVPRTQYNIDMRNNILHFIEETNPTTELIATISKGEYTNSSLATAIKTALDTAGVLTYTVTHNPTTNKYTISATGNFKLLFEGTNEQYDVNNTRSTYRDNSIGNTIGFSRNDTDFGTSFTSTNRVNLGGEKYIYLKVNDFNVINTTWQNHNLKYFAKILFDDATLGGFEFYTNNSGFPNIKYFSPPLGSLDTLDIEYRNYDGTLYNFNGHDASFTLLIHTVDMIH